MRHLRLLAAILTTLTLPAAAQQSKTAATPVAKTADQSQAPAAPAREPGLYMTFETDMGNITCKLYEKEAPITVGKIVGLATGKITGKAYYDGIIFHRVIPQFMIQGGDPTGTGTGGPNVPGFPFQDEFVPTLKFDLPGRLAMANSGPRTNGSQFFITEVPTPHLNGKHTIFGDCGNADVVRRIARVPTNPQNNKPLTTVRIKHVAVERVGPAPASVPESKSVAPAAKTTAKAPAKKTP